MPTKERTYNETEIADRLKDLPGWYFEDGLIRRVYKTDGWPTTLMLVNAIGYLSEAAYHHPDLSVTWGRLTVKLSTHSAGGITDKDFELARKIETSCCGVRQAARSRARRTSSCGAAIRANGRGLRVSARYTCPVRYRQAGGTGAAARARGDEPAVQRRRGGDADHGGGADDHGVDRPLAGGAVRHRPGDDPGVVRGRRRHSGGEDRRARRERAERPA
jgi:4a-hydroxytetrahydrobiopterin dehydratase